MAVTGKDDILAGLGTSNEICQLSLRVAYGYAHNRSEL
jgi:hypothetical protein